VEGGLRSGDEHMADLQWKNMFKKKEKNREIYGIRWKYGGFNGNIWDKMEIWRL